MKKQVTTLGLAVLGCGFLVPQAMGQGQPATPGLQAGAAKVDITPTADEFPYQQGREKAFVGVHDPLFVRAIALRGGSTKALLISVEVTTIPRPQEVVAAIAKATGLPASAIMISATHTHEAPLVFYHSAEADPVQAKEIARIIEASATAGREALAHLQPASIAFARGAAYVNINNGEAADRTDWNDPAGPSDKSLDVLRITAADGKPLALVVNYASHAEVMYRSVTKDGGYLVTGDLPGRSSTMLEESARGAPVVLFNASAEADQLTIFKSLAPDGNLPGADQGPAGWALLEVQARRLVSSVIDTLATMPSGDSHVTVSIDATTASCPGQQWKRDPATGTMTRSERAPVVIPLQLLRVGDIALGGVGGDMDTAIGTTIKAAGLARNTMVVSMLAGSVGYIFPDARYDHPGHGLYGSSLQPGCAVPAIVAGLKAMAGR